MPELRLDLLQPGLALTVRGVAYSITDADQYTRSFLEQQRIAVGPAIPCPVEQAEQVAAATKEMALKMSAWRAAGRACPVVKGGRGKGGLLVPACAQDSGASRLGAVPARRPPSAPPPPRPRGAVAERQDPDSPTRFAEVRLGKPPPSAKTRQYLAHSNEVRQGGAGAVASYFRTPAAQSPPVRASHAPQGTGQLHQLRASRRRAAAAPLQVLRFYALWNDTANLCGDAHHMELRYYLADDTVGLARHGEKRGVFFFACSQASRGHAPCSLTAGRARGRHRQGGRPHLSGQDSGALDAVGGCEA